MFKKIRLGYPGGFHDPECGDVVSELRCNRTVILTRKGGRGQHPPENIATRAAELAAQNIADLLGILKYNESRGIKFFRISSEICPHISNWRIIDGDVLDYKRLAYSLDLFAGGLAAVSKFAKKHGHRLTFHPGPFTILNTDKKFVLASVKRELWWHAQFLEALGLPESSLTLHIGGVYGNRKTSAARFIKNFRELPEVIRKYIIIENDENNYCAEDLLDISAATGIPVCFDYFHYLCWNVFHRKDPQKYRKQAPADKLIPRILATWGTRRPKFHLSEQYPGKVLGTHSMFIKKIPKILRGLDIDLMLESKCKELTLLALTSNNYE